MHAKSIYPLQSTYLVCTSSSLMAVPRLERCASGLAPSCVTRDSMLDAQCSMLARDAIIHLPTQADYACVVSSPALVSTVPYLDGHASPPPRFAHATPPGLGRRHHVSPSTAGQA